MLATLASVPPEPRGITASDPAFRGAPFTRYWAVGPGILGQVAHANRGLTTSVRIGHNVVVESLARLPLGR
jgi:hypothetical protein